MGGFQFDFWNQDEHNPLERRVTFGKQTPPAPHQKQKAARITQAAPTLARGSLKIPSGVYAVAGASAVKTTEAFRGRRGRGGEADAQGQRDSGDDGGQLCHGPGSPWFV